MEIERHTQVAIGDDDLGSNTKKYTIGCACKFVLLFVVIMLAPQKALSQNVITNTPYVTSRNNECIIQQITLTDSETQVLVKVPKGLGGWGGWVSFSSNIVILLDRDWISEDGKRAYLKINNLGRDQLDIQYKTSKSDHYFILYFDRIPRGCTNIDIKELLLYSDGFEWNGVKLNNPYPLVETTGMNESSVKANINSNNDGITGIYEGFDNDGYKLGCIKQNNAYKLVYLGGKKSTQWKIGEIKAHLYPSATFGFFKADWFMANKTKESNAYVVFEGGSMKIVISNDEVGYLKMYPTSANTGRLPQEVQEWSGTGFALNNGYIVTNYHVVEKAKRIYVQGVKGDFLLKYEATVVASDKSNDLALLSINDSHFKGFGNIPYKVKTSTSEVGEEVFVLGYPLTSTMGDEIKLTAGIISSKTGFQGDVSLYQISAPIQPGNSGGPLFDAQGNLIGVVNSKHKGAENVGYAIKTSYLKNLVESAVSSSIFPNNNQVSGMALTGKVKILRNFVYMINCSNQQSFFNHDFQASPASDSKFNDIDVSNPPISIIPNDNKGLKINRIQITLDQTIIDLEYDNVINQSGWVCIDENTYIVSYDTGKKYKMVKAEGISIDPQKHYFSSVYDKLNFRLIFPALPKTTTKFNLIENENSSWKFYGIKLE